MNSWNSIKKNLSGKVKYVSSKRRAYYAVADARKILRELPESIIDCVITSPPYGNLKNYGPKKQIGYGQNPENEYFPDLTKVLAELHRVVVDQGAMWIVLDNLKLSGQTIPLPWEIINRACEVGWSLHDVLVWDKGRSLPWSHKGRFRGVCEFILLFGKGTLKVFNLDAVRDTEYLSSYWVKYPERFHPDGKAPSDLWHFPIPIQGSWSMGKGPSRHFCPFPIELVARMIAITTKRGNIVLDPFAGTGVVSAMASYLERYGLGFDVNRPFAVEFDKSGFARYLLSAKSVLPKEKGKNYELREVIVKLRMMKFSKALYSQIARADRLNGDARAYICLFLVTCIEIRDQNKDTIDTRNVGKISIHVLVCHGVDVRDLGKKLKRMISMPPLSKYGVVVDLKVVPARVWASKKYRNAIKKGRWFLYKNGVFHKYSKEVTKAGAADLILSECKSSTSKVPSIISNIEIDSALPVED